MTTHTVKVHAVQRYGTRGARVHASVDGRLVFWDPCKGGWRCERCPDAQAVGCAHITAVNAFLGPEVIGKWSAES